MRKTFTQIHVFCLISLALWTVTSVYAVDSAPTDEAMLRRVADHILEHTTRRLIDHTTGMTYTDSTGLMPRAELSIESKFNAWFYQNWLLAEGMRSTSAALQEPRYAQYGEQNLAFIYKHVDYFNRQHDAKIIAAPVGDGKLSPIGFHFQINALWQTGIAPLVLEQYAVTKDERYKPFLVRVRSFLKETPRFDDGAFYRKGKGMMTDDPYMTVPFLVRDWRFNGEAATLDDAIAQVMGTHTRLFDPTVGLLKHLWDLNSRTPAGEFWGRGNGWTLMAHVELLAALPQDHPRRNEVLVQFVRHIEGLRRYQDPNGGWHQVLTVPTSWVETSATAMITYCIARGVNEGWLNPSFAADARKGWAALQAKVLPDGDLVDVCGSTDTGDLTFYLKRPRVQGDLHGFGSYLLAGAEIIRMGQTKEHP